MKINIRDKYDKEIEGIKNIKFNFINIISNTPHFCNKVINEILSLQIYYNIQTWLLKLQFSSNYASPDKLVI